MRTTPPGPPSAAPPAAPAPRRIIRGFTLLELLLVTAILAALCGMAAMNVRGLHNEAAAGGAVLQGALTEARTRAIATTSAVRATLTAGALTLDTTASGACDATSGWTALPAPALPAGLTLTGATGWTACWTPRGRLLTLPPGALTLRDARGRTRTLTLYLTGMAVAQ